MYGDHRITYLARDERLVTVQGRLLEVTPSGLDFRLLLGGEAGERRIGARQIRELVNLDTGEVVENAWPYFLALFLDAACDDTGRVPLRGVIDALPITGVGPVAARTLAGHFRRWPDFRDALAGEPEDVYDRMIEVDGIGDSTAMAIADFVRDPARRTLLNHLGARLEIADAGSRSRRSGPLAGRTLVFTGTLPNLSRTEAKRMAEDAGAQVSGSVAPQVSYCVAGESSGSKKRKAEKLGVPVLDEAGFRALLDDG